MAVYKVIQDVEAEDKLLGPLGIRQFVYAAIVGLLGFICFRLYVTPELGVFRVIIIVPLLLPMVLFAVLASPLGRTQSTETWLLSRLRFFFKPQRRVWDQMGAKNLVTITAPKKDPVIYVKDFTQSEVRSRLEILATTLDSRGWAVKDSALNDYTHPGYSAHSEDNNQRLVGIQNLPQNDLTATALPSDDIMDGQNNATAQHVDKLMQEKAVKQREKIMDEIELARQGKKSTAQSPRKPGAVIGPDPNSAEYLETIAKASASPEDALLEHIREQKKIISNQHIENDHLKKVLPISEQKRLAAEETAIKAAENEARIKDEQARAAAAAKRSAIIDYMAKNSDEITPASVSAITKHKLENDGALHNGDEVVISLH